MNVGKFFDFLGSGVGEFQQVRAVPRLLLDSIKACWKFGCCKFGYLSFFFTLAAESKKAAQWIGKLENDPNNGFQK